MAKVMLTAQNDYKYNYVGNLGIHNESLNQLSDTSGYSKLYQAVTNGESAYVIELLIKFEIEINARAGCKKLTALSMGVMKGDYDIVCLLLNHGADSLITDSKGCTALMIAAENGFGKIAKLLLSKDTTDKLKNMANNNGYTALHLAVEKNYEIIVRHLIASNSLLDCQNDDGASPVFLASELGCVYILGLLVAAGADVNLSNKYGNSALHIAARNGNIDIAYCLVADGKADINLQNQDGNTALHVAILYGKEDVIKYLLSCERKHLKNRNGKTADDLLDHMNFFDVHSPLALSTWNKETIRKVKISAVTRMQGSIRESGRKLKEMRKFLQVGDSIPLDGVQLDMELLHKNNFNPALNKKVCQKDVHTAESQTTYDDETNLKKLSEADVSQYEKDLEDNNKELTQLKTVICPGRCPPLTKKKNLSKKSTNGTKITVFPEDMTDISQKFETLEDKISVLAERINELYRLNTNDPDMKENEIGNFCGNVSDKVLYEIAKQLGNDWKELGIHLNLSHKELERLQIDHPGSVIDAIRSMLITWRDNRLSASVSNMSNDHKLQQLFRALTEMNRFDAVEKVQQFIYNQGQLVKYY